MTDEETAELKQQAESDQLALNEMLKTILLDVFKKHGDLCSLCEVKGQKLPECKCMKDNECLEHIIELYGAKDERKTEEAEN